MFFVGLDPSFHTAAWPLLAMNAITDGGQTGGASAAVIQAVIAALLSLDRHVTAKRLAHRLPEGSSTPHHMPVSHRVSFIAPVSDGHRPRRSTGRAKTPSVAGGDIGGARSHSSRDAFLPSIGDTASV